MPIMTFQTRYSHCEFLVMYFCLTNVSITFIDFMNREFMKYLDSFVIVFINDILVYSKSEDEHMDHLRVVLEVLKEHQHFDKYSNSEFWLRSVAFLGHIFSREGIEVNSM